VLGSIQFYNQMGATLDEAGKTLGVFCVVTEESLCNVVCPARTAGCLNCCFFKYKMANSVGVRSFIYDTFLLCYKLYLIPSLFIVVVGFLL
jgi:hypothetical protein